MPASNKMAESQQPYTATAVLLLLRSDQRFFFTSFPEGAGLLESLPGFDDGAVAGTAISFGAAKAASSKLVGRAATFTTGRSFSSLTFLGSAVGFGLGSVATVVLDWIGSSSVNLVILDVLRPFFVGESEAAVGAAGISVGVLTMAVSSSLVDSALPISAYWGAASPSTFSTVGTVAVLVESDALDATGTIVTELALDAADENTSGVVMAVPNCMGGSAGTGGTPGARELVRGAWGLRETDWFGSEILRDRPGCSL